MEDGVKPIWFEWKEELRVAIAECFWGVWGIFPFFWHSARTNVLEL